MVRIRIGSREATVDNYQWSGESEPLVRWLESRKNPRGPSPSDPDPDLTLAEEAIRVLGGEIVEADEPEEFPEGTVY